jgi:purine-binding chemotaxis protein CheW
MINTVDTTINSYLSFKLGDELFAANVAKVLEILELTKITKVPKAPAYMRGVINLRGNVLPVVDARIKFNMQKTEDTVNTCIVVLDIQMDGDSINVGILVDSVQEVLEITEDEIKPPPSIGSKYKSDFIQGMVKNEEEFIMILNIDTVLSSNELTMLQETAEDVNTRKADVEKQPEQKAEKKQRKT